MSVSASSARLPVHVKLRLAMEILRAYVLVRRLLRRHGLSDTLAGLRAAPPDRLPLSAGDERRLARAVVRNLSVLPTDSRCLMRSLVLTRLLARRGIESELVIAVSPGESFAAHAWVEHDSEPLLPPGTSDFSRLVSL